MPAALLDEQQYRLFDVTGVELHPLQSHLHRSHLVRTMQASTSERVSELDGSAPESTDFANYFCTYAYLYHQVSKLELK